LERQIVQRDFDAVPKEGVRRSTARRRQCGVRIRFELKHGVRHAVQGDDAALGIVSGKQGYRGDVHNRLQLFDAPAELLFEALTATDIPGGPDEPDRPPVRIEEHAASDPDPALPGVFDAYRA